MGLPMNEGYAIILPPVLLISGPAFAKCPKVEDVLSVIQGSKA